MALTVEPSLDSALEKAFEAADAAGDILIAGMNRKLKVEEKSQANFVSEVDIASEKAVFAILRQAFPHHGFLGEESGISEGGAASDYLWIVDPLDGTSNYLKGFPYFCVSLALVKRGAGGIVEPQLGLVFNPVSGEYFWTRRGGGAWLRKKGGADRRLSVTGADSIADALLVTGFYYDRGENMRRTLRQIEAFYGEGMMCIRRFGAAALDLAQVAAGRVDGFWEHFLNPWDFAAAALLVEEAGGVCSNWQGLSLGATASPVCAASPGLHRKMLSLVNRI